MALQFRILGPLEVVTPEGPLKLGGAKQQTVLGTLLLEPNRVVSVERLIAWVWGDEMAERNATLQVYVSNLRRLLAPHAGDGRSYVVTQRPGYLIHVDASELDALEFAQARGEAESALAAGDAEHAVGLLRRALGLWRGQPLAGLPIGSGTAGDLTRLEVARTTATELLAGAELDLGRHQQIADEIRGWVSEHPLNEQLRGLLMLALYRCGWQADALATYREGRRLLLEELGIDPSKELRDLENRMLVQDPALDFERRSTGRVPMVDGTVVRSSVRATPAHLRLGDEAFPLNRTRTTIGRLEDRDVVLSDPAASRTHAEIRSTPEGYVLVDTASANGTSVGGRRVHQHLLGSGDVIVIGDTELTFVAGSVSSAVQP